MNLSTLLVALATVCAVCLAFPADSDTQFCTCVCRSHSALEKSGMLGIFLHPVERTSEEFDTNHCRCKCRPQSPSDVFAVFRTLPTPFEPTPEMMKYLWLKAGDGDHDKPVPDFKSIIKTMTREEKEEVRKLMEFFYATKP